MVDYTPIPPNSSDPEVAVNAALAAFSAAIDEVAEGAVLPEGGTAGQFLAKTSNGLAWVDPPNSASFPPGGTTGQALVRAANGGVEWKTIGGTTPVPVAPSYEMWRVRVLTGNDPNFLSFYGIQFRETVGVKQLVSGGTIIENGTRNGFSPADAFDDNDNTRWALNNIATLPNAYLGYKFASAKAISEVWLFCPPSETPKDYVIEAKNVSDSSWNIIKSISNQTSWGSTSSAATTINLVPASSLKIPKSGTAAAPSFPVEDDLNTGIYAPSADTLALSTAGIERMRWRADGVLEVTGPPPVRDSYPLLTPMICFSDLGGDGTAANPYYAGGFSAQAKNPYNTTWSTGAVWGTVGTDGNTGGYPGGLALMAKSANYDFRGGIIEVARATAYGAFQIGTTADYETLAVNSSVKLVTKGNQIPSSDNSYSLGLANYKYSVVYAGTGTINTSDQREKTEVRELTLSEIRASVEISKEIGVFKYLSSIQDKGYENARSHIGLTVQRVIEILKANNLDPMSYAFICYDKWDVIPAKDEVAYDPGEIEEEIKDEDGNVIKEAVIIREITLYQPYVPEIPAGDRYGFRPDQLSLFLARGLAERINQIETKLG